MPKKSTGCVKKEKERSRIIEEQKEEGYSKSRSVIRCQERQVK